MARDAPARRAKAKNPYGLKTQSASRRPEEAELDRYELDRYGSGKRAGQPTASAYAIQVPKTSLARRQHGALRLKLYMAE